MDVNQDLTLVDNNKNDKNNVVTLSQLEQMEERMSRALAATIQTSVNNAIDDKLRPIQQSINQLLENKQETEKFQEDVTKLVKENKTITYMTCKNKVKKTPSTTFVFNLE